MSSTVTRQLIGWFVIFMFALNVTMPAQKVEAGWPVIDAAHIAQTILRYYEDYQRRRQIAEQIVQRGRQITHQVTNLTRGATPYRSLLTHANAEQALAIWDLAGYDDKREHRSLHDQLRRLTILRATTCRNEWILTQLNGSRGKMLSRSPT